MMPQMEPSSAQIIATISAGSARLFCAGWRMAIPAQMIAGMPVSKPQPSESGPSTHAQMIRADIAESPLAVKGEAGVTLAPPIKAPIGIQFELPSAVARLVRLKRPSAMYCRMTAMSYGPYGFWSLPCTQYRGIASVIVGSIHP